MARKTAVKDWTIDDLDKHLEMLAQTTAWLNQETADQDAEINDVKKAHARNIRIYRRQIANIKKACRAWARAHKKTHFKEPRSLVLPHGTISMQRGQWTVKPVRGNTIASIIENLKTWRWGKKYLRYREPDLNKEALIEDRDLLGDDRKQALGIRFVQEERTHVEPNLESLKKTTAA